MPPAGPRHVGAKLAGSDCSLLCQPQPPHRSTWALAPILSVDFRDVPPSPGTCAYTIFLGVRCCISARPSFSLGWSIMGAQPGLITGHSGFPPSAAFPLRPRVYWDCIPFISRP